MIENDVAIIVGSMPAFSTFFRDRVAGGSLWRSFASALRSNKDSTSKGSMMDKYWRSSGKSPYTLTSRSRSDADIELTGIHVVSEGGPTKIGVDVTGIVRTVDISQQVHTRPESTRNLF
jgi:hypothetical protein